MNSSERPSDGEWRLVHLLAGIFSARLSQPELFDCRREARTMKKFPRLPRQLLYGSSVAVERWSRGILELIFPPHCQLCGGELDESLDLPGGPLPISDFCGECLSRLVREPRLPLCRRCGLPSAGDAGTRCVSCRRQSFGFSEVIALGPYEDEIRRAVIRMKQFHEHPLTAAMGRLLADRLNERWRDDLPDVVVPIPKFWLKRLMRGVNSAELLAESLGRKVRRPVWASALQCRRATQKQSLLTISQRRANAKDSLRLHSKYSWTGKDVLIVDDIMTTGSTTNEAARVLRKAGARRIRVAVVARAFPMK